MYINDYRLKIRKFEIFIQAKDKLTLTGQYIVGQNNEIIKMKFN